MTHPAASRPTLLALLVLTALVGCDTPAPTPTPSPPDPYTDVQFNLTVPPETPVDARIFLYGEDPGFSGRIGGGLELIYQGGLVFSGKTRLPKEKAVSYEVRLASSPDQGDALDLAGVRKPAYTFTARELVEQKVDLTVERWGPATGQTRPQTVFLVAAPESTPREDTIWLAGNQPELGGWNPSGAKLYKAVDSHYATTLSFAPGTSLEFKVTRGEWAKVENSSEGKSVDNRAFTTGGGFERVTFTVANWEDLYKAPVEHTTTGNIEYLRDVPSAYATQAKRDVIVWLPPGYELPENAARRYPVLYMHDGQNVMDAATSYAGEWKVDETARDLINAGEVEPVIIVGVYNAGADRAIEYTQVPDPRWKDIKGEQCGKADGYGRFLVEELKPRIDGTYRTKTGAADTGLVGSSLGGLVSMYLGMTHAETFTRLGVVSPSVFWGDSDILARVEALPGKLSGTRIWLDIGTKEGTRESQEETVESTRKLRDRLTAKGWVLDADLKYVEIEGAGHNEGAWSARFGDILKYLFPAN
ncbi:alpha/beta hydrolase-fold protein [Archangium primigenium]|uniref:alpha/beta hydrolase-fold protein n=1 Tax=[Archangium] primigenium TaxID=2792470 RepID=UPI00195AEE1C|nr:alpha/beta hydrolase-fold protein [Archangium primigenium]MBM7113935.1 carbohydrate esterase [Archangium primigenium]